MFFPCFSFYKISIFHFVSRCRCSNSAAVQVNIIPIWSTMRYTQRVYPVAIANKTFVGLLHSQCTNKMTTFNYVKAPVWHYTYEVNSVKTKRGRLKEKWKWFPMYGCLYTVFLFLVTLKAALCINVRMGMCFWVKLDSMSPNCCCYFERMLLITLLHMKRKPNDS